MVREQCGAVGGVGAEREPLLTWEQQCCHGRLVSLGPLQLGGVSLAALLDAAVALAVPAMVSTTAAATLADLPVKIQFLFGFFFFVFF